MMFGRRRKKKPATPVYDLSLPEPEYVESIRAVVGGACLFFKYHPVAVTFNDDAARVREIMGGELYHEAGGAVFNEQCLRYVQDNMNEIRAALGTTVCICDK